MVAVTAHRTLADPRDFRVSNANPSFAVTGLYVAVSGPDDDWGADLLQGSPLAAGAGGTVRFDATDAGQCVYDIRAVYGDGTERQFLNINICTTDVVTVS